MKAKRYFRAIISVLTAVSMTIVPVSELPVVPHTITAFAGTTYDSLTYVIKGRKVVITGCDREATSVWIPNYIENLPVSEIAYNAFSGCSQLRSVTLPSNLTAIPAGCFFSCEALSKVELPEGLTEIGENAFGYCPNLREITFPASLKSIQLDAFNSAGLTAVTLPEGIEVANYAFRGCESLTDVTISEGVQKMPGAFMDCTALKTISIPASVTDLTDTLAGCTALETIIVDPNNAAYQTIDNVLLTKDGSCLVTYPPTIQRTAYTVPDTVTEIPNYAFANLKDLTSITFPPQMTKIGEGAFMNCSGLTQLTIPDGVKQLDIMTFVGCTSLERLTLPKSLTKIGRKTFHCPLLSEIDFGGSVQDWSKISIGEDNLTLYQANVHFDEEDTAGLTNVTLYTAPSVLPVPEENRSYQIKTASPDAAYRIMAGAAAEVSETGIVTPTKRYGDTFIEITDGEDISFLHVTTADYAPVYADETISAFLAENITEDMTDLEKLQVIGKLPTSMDYDHDHWDYTEMLAYHTGNCGGSATMLVEMCRRLGIKAWVRNANRDPGAGSAHLNALAEVDGVYYELEAGYEGTAPRPYKVTERTSLYKYQDASDGIEVYQYDGINERETALELPETIDDRTVTTIGDGFLKENPWVKSVTIPDSVTEISESAFPDYQGILFGEEGSAAEEFAKAHDIAFRVTGSLTFGDVNADGRIDIMDVIAVNQFILGVGHLNTTQIAAADVDGNQNVDSTDSLLILKYVVELIEKFDQKEGETD